MPRQKYVTVEVDILRTECETIDVLVDHLKLFDSRAGFVAYLIRKYLEEMDNR